MEYKPTMKKEISVDRAVTINYLLNNSMYTIGAFASIAALILFSQDKDFSGESAIIFSFIILSVCTILIVVFNLRLSKIWIFWAFSRVENVHELKKRLILLGEISEKSILFERIENSTEYDRKYWKLRLKFAREDIFVDDKTIPEETCIYYSKTMNIMLMVLSIFFFALGSLFLVLQFTPGEKNCMVAIFGVFLLIIAVILGYRHGYMKLKNREPQLILNSKGINSNKVGFHKWEEIEKLVIITGRSTGLKFSHPSGKKRIDISYLKIRKNGLKLSKLLMVYRERNILQNRNNSIR